MSSESQQGCVSPAAGPLLDTSGQDEAQAPDSKEREVVRMTVTVGTKAPDFEANAFYKDGFKTVKLSDFLGKWVLLCFYPGDFTFV